MIGEPSRMGETQMPELQRQEIFATGTWNGETFVEEDQDDIVQNFEKLKKEHEVPLKFGHNEEQEGAGPGGNIMRGH